MAINAQEIGRFKAALARSANAAKPPSAPEISDFVHRLKRISIETLRERLSEPVSGQKWRRDLAAAELGRRDDLEQTPIAAGAHTPHRTFSVSDVIGWRGWLAGGLIAASSALVLYMSYLVWSL